MLHDLALQFYKEHGAVESKKKVYDTLVSFAIYTKQSEGARNQHRLTLLFKALVGLRDYQEVKRKGEESVKLVTSFFRCSLATKVVKALKDNTVSNKQHREKAFAKFKTRRVIRCLTKLKVFARKQAQVQQMQSGAQLKICQLWMQHSFSKVMEVVWRDFPKQELK